MSVAELMKGARRLKPDERVALMAYLKHLARKDDPAYQAELTRLNAEIDSGRKFTLEQVERMHAALKAEGM